VYGAFLGRSEIMSLGTLRGLGSIPETYKPLLLPGHGVVKSP
jgi:hypothetical protein